MLTTTKRGPFQRFKTILQPDKDTNVGNSYQTNNLHAQHHLDQAINNPISSNSQQNRDHFGESNSKFFNY